MNWDDVPDDEEMVVNLTAWVIIKMVRAMDLPIPGIHRVMATVGCGDNYRDALDWLTNLLWAPSKEQIDDLCAAIERELRAN